MNRAEIEAPAAKHDLGKVYFQWREQANTGRLVEVGWLARDGELVLFCKRSSRSTPNDFYLCPPFENLK